MELVIKLFTTNNQSTHLKSINVILRKYEAQISNFVTENYEISHTSITWKFHKITTLLYCKRLYSKLLTHTTLFRVSETQVFVMVDRQYIPVYSDTRIGGFEVKNTKVRGERVRYIIMSYPSGERLCLLLWRDAALKQPKQNEIIIVIEVPHYTYIL